MAEVARVEVLADSMMKKKRARTSSDSAIVDVWRRELGQLSSRNFANRLAASEDVVLRLDLLRKLDRHRGCVNTVCFNASGDLLVSGSDDRRVILWDWESGQVKLNFHSGHVNNVFQAKFMPYSDDRSIVTCAADGQVRHAQILESGVDTKLLSEHEGRVHKLAIEPGSPHIFYTCGEDGLVQHIDLRTGSATSLFICKPFVSSTLIPTLHLNAITIDPRNPNLFAIGGSDPFARVYDIRKYKWDGSSEFGQPADYFCPKHLVDYDSVGITGLAYSDQSELLVSYSDEFIYLFTKDLGLGPSPTFSSQVSDSSDSGGLTADNLPDTSLSNVEGEIKADPQSYKGHRNCETVKGVNFFGPKCEYVVSGSDCGRIFIWKKKCGQLVRVMEADKHVVNCVEPHPHATVLASSGIEHDIKMWIPKAINKATLPTNIKEDNRVLHLIPQRFRFFDLGDYNEDEDDEFICSDEDNSSEGDGDEDEDEEDDEDEDGDFIFDDEYELVDDDDDGEDGGDSNDDDDDDDDEGEDDSDDNNDDDGGGQCNNGDHITENHDNGGNEVSNEQLEEEDDNEGDDSADFVYAEDLHADPGFGPNTSCQNEIENISGSEGDIDIFSAGADDSFLDISDTDSNGGNEVLNELEEENDIADFVFAEDLDAYPGLGLDTSCRNEIEDISEFEDDVDIFSAGADDSFLDISDTDNYSDFGW